MEAPEVKVTELKKDMVAVVKAVRDLNTSVNKLEENAKMDQYDEVQEIIKSQEMIDRIIVANSDSIKRLDREIAKLEREKVADHPVKVQED